ncbi:54S ribosomal protein L15, mitochondrial [Neolecta irregularis DAH-3]|uniref:54S ribosomal protein L15, mitochondrial n=1 Tax=Neolecta irregularis (strain DAH-3) TaxID=1198029 RepID=A0A1U7LUS7_NEOID|nr:54S ribosomal protein L15, mitochondrial [Neolecta irregularis DAH-3]|eukprot:OLL26333.1 54S ribosomal protein L15, mitochondrial [Neolecta irregularis DAH-3]
MSLRPRSTPFAVNTDSRLLHRFYLALLGAPPDSYLLPSLVWQCVTHKSYSHGSLPYNDKLAFLGAALLPVLSLTQGRRTIKFVSLSKTLQTAGLESVENPVTAKTSSDAIHNFALQHNVSAIMRWKPAFADLHKSAKAQVASECVEAIIGGIALSKGAAKAQSFCLERILPS